MPDLTYDGRTLQWSGKGSFKATSGLSGHQKPSEQCEIDQGPIPEGRYLLGLTDHRLPARDDGAGVCNLVPGRGVQRIPRGVAAGACEPYWANWGWNRVHLEPADAKTQRRCTPRRGGFYIHDSRKGFTHGCIEVEGRFFTILRSYITDIKTRKLPARRTLTLEVRYVPGQSTNGGTKQP